VALAIGGVAEAAEAVTDINSGTSTFMKAWRMKSKLDAKYPVDHHLFPRKFRDWFEGKGIKIDEYCVTLTAEKHWSLHPKWEREWEAFKNSNPSASVAAIKNKAAEMMEDAGILDRYIHLWKEGSGAVGFR
jgi:hypothetical protein